MPCLRNTPRRRGGKKKEDDSPDKRFKRRPYFSDSSSNTFCRHFRIARSRYIPYVINNNDLLKYIPRSSLGPRKKLYYSRINGCSLILIARSLLQNVT